MDALKSDTIGKTCHVTENDYNWRAIDKRLMKLVAVGDSYEDCCANAVRKGYVVAELFT